MLFQQYCITLGYQIKSQVSIPTFKSELAFFNRGKITLTFFYRATVQCILYIKKKKEFNLRELKDPIGVAASADLMDGGNERKSKMR